MARADAPGGSRVAVTLPPGLSASEHAALERSGAYGMNPLRLMIVGDSIAMTLGEGLSVQSESSYGVTVSDYATLGCDLDPQLEVLTAGAPGPATPGCQDWRATWPFLSAGLRPQVVALGLGRWEVADHLFNGQWVHVGEPAWDGHLTAELRSAIAIFHRYGARLLPTPAQGRNHVLHLRRRIRTISTAQASLNRRSTECKEKVLRKPSEGSR